MDERLELFRFNDRIEFLKALDSVLPEKFQKVRNDTKYYPIEIKQAVADDLFHYWNVSGEKYELIVNELVCTISISYMPSYPGADELHCTGSAAVPVQMDKGSIASNFPKGKKTNALEYNLPGVRSEAIGNALLTLGNCFGRSLNRKTVKDNFSFRRNIFDSIEKEPEPEPEPEIKKEPENAKIDVRDLPF